MWGRLGSWLTNRWIHSLWVSWKGKNKQLKGKILSCEVYGKWLSLLIHELEEDQTNPWKNWAAIEKLLNEFVTIGKKMENPAQVNIVASHRLPQYPLFNYKERLNRPIILISLRYWNQVID